MVKCEVIVSANHFYLTSILQMVRPGGTKVMYEPPIQLVVNEVSNRFKEAQEKYIWESIQNLGLNIDKTELILALKYDRDQYDKGYDDGYQDGYNHGVDSIKKEILKLLEGKGNVNDISDNACSHKEADERG